MLTLLKLYQILNFVPNLRTKAVQLSTGLPTSIAARVFECVPENLTQAQKRYIYRLLSEACSDQMVEFIDLPPCPGQRGKPRRVYFLSPAAITLRAPVRVRTAGSFAEAMLSDGWLGKLFPEFFASVADELNALPKTFAEPETRILAFVRVLPPRKAASRDLAEGTREALLQSMDRQRVCRIEWAAGAQDHQGDFAIRGIVGRNDDWYLVITHGMFDKPGVIRLDLVTSADCTTTPAASRRDFDLDAVVKQLVTDREFDKCGTPVGQIA